MVFGAKMLIVVFAILYNVLPGTVAEVNILNGSLGDLHFNARVGNLPFRYKPMNEVDQNAADKAAELIDMLPLMPNIDPLKRARLAPLGIDIPILWFSGKVFLQNVVVSGIKQLILNYLEIRVTNLRTDVNISIPVLNFEADFNLQSKFSLFSIIFRCHISVQVKDVDVLASAAFITTQVPVKGEVLQIYSAEVNIDVGDVKYNITNVVTGGSVGDMDSRSAVTQLFKGKSEGNFYDGLLQTAVGIANKYLQQVSTEVIKSYLLSN